MSNTKQCRSETLAHGASVVVQRCVECGGISIHLGYLSLRMEQADLENLWTVLGEAVAELHTRRLGILSRPVQRGVT